MLLFLSLSDPPESPAASENETNLHQIPERGEQILRILMETSIFGD